MIGNFKDKTFDVQIIEFLGLRKKIHSCTKDNEKRDRTAKEIKKNITRRKIKHKDRKNILFHSKEIHHMMKTI